MYQERIRHATPKLIPNGQLKFHIRLSDFPFDERVRYIESVCETLIESRFGPEYFFQAANWSDRPELDPTPLSDYLFDDEVNERVPFYAHFSQGGKTYGRKCESERAHLRYWDASRGLACLVSDKFSGTQVFSVAALPPNQGRGSP